MANALSDSFVAEGTDQEEPEAPETPETPAEPGDEAPGQQAQPEKVPLNGRRAAAKQRQDELLAELRSVRETVTKQSETYNERLARIQQENAELRGTLQGYIARPQQQQPQEKTPDPEELREQARKALDEKDFPRYEKLSSAATAAEVIRQLAPRFQQQQQSQPQVHPMLSSIAAGYGDVMGDPDAFDMCQTADRRLARSGMPESPQRWQLAFEEGRRYLKGKTKQNPQFSQRGREVLSQPSTSRGNGKDANVSKGPGVRLNATEREYAKKFKMTLDDYAKEVAAMHPERIEDG